MTKAAKEIRLELDPTITERLKTIKEHYGLKRNTDAVRFLISDEYDRIYGNKKK